MTHYKSNLRDLEFNLFEVLDTAASMGSGLYEDIDVDTAKDILREVERITSSELAAPFADADRNPPVFDPATNTVKIPESFKKAFKTMMDAEYWRLDLPTEIGGTNAPRTLWWALGEMVLGANPALWMYAAGPSFAGTLNKEGTETQRKWAELFVEKKWGATMVLTEPDAGSDVGAGVTKAYPQPDGSWHIEGVKRFITSGEHDMSDNIIHYVLARPVGVDGVGGPGTKGLSLFIVPKYHFDSETGELGERNGVNATGVEHKMGLKVSTTCEMTFGGATPAKGWLMGDKHEGIRQMFLIIEYARMMVGTKAIATLSTGYLNALEYAKSRVQGADLLQSTDKTAPRVTITHHPDVRRSLLMQKAYSEGMRALVLYTAKWQDKGRIAVHENDTEAAKLAHRVNDLLLPLIKGCGSERAYELLSSETLQTFGGSGFLQDYPIEQYVRDSKIDSLYEGTTAIQSLDLVFRKIVKDGGVALGTVATEIGEFLSSDGSPELKQTKASLGEALENVQGMLGSFGTVMGASQQGEPRELYKVGLHSRRLLLAMGDVVIGWLLARHAEVAQSKLDAGASGADADFYTGKVAAAKFFAAEVLPRLYSDRKIIESANLATMDVPESAF